MIEKSLGAKAATGAIWASIDKFSSMVLQFLVNLILARLLLPSDFGAIGMLTIFISVSQVLIDGGFGSALIQKKNPTQSDYSTIFFWNIFFSTIIYLFIFILSPYIGDFFSMPILSKILRVVGLGIIVNSVLDIQATRLRKNLAFKKLAITNLGSYSLSATIAIISAYNGFGVWSLVIMQLSYGIFSIIVLRIISGWSPSFSFSKESLKGLFYFGGYIMASNILQEICRNIQGIIIGRSFSATQMGYYSQAQKLDTIVSYSIPQVIVQVMYPVYSSVQDDKDKLIDIIKMNLRVIAVLIFPILVVLIILANILIEFLYGNKWVNSVIYFQILCCGGFFVCLQNVNYYAVAAIGKSKPLFIWSFYKWFFLILSIFIGSLWGMNGIMWGMVCGSINIYVINALLTSKYVGLRFYYQIKCLSPIFLTTIISVSLSYIASLIIHNDVLICMIFGFCYVVICLISKLKALDDLKLIINKITETHKLKFI